jgi:CheY-like chemotaxis protein
MAHVHGNILIVDDNVDLRVTLTVIFSYAGYSVRSAADGFSALAEMRRETPDVLISDLNMPGMSGFELLSVVRRRFPAVRVIAISGSFSGDKVPQGVAADAFYQKGKGGVEPLMRLVRTLTERNLPLARHAPIPVWISRTGTNRYGDAHVAITCPECFRVFPQHLGEQNSSTEETRCLHCSSAVQFALVEPVLEMDRTGLSVAMAS